MTRGLSPLALANLLLAAGLVAVGLPSVVAVTLRLPSRSAIVALERGSAVDRMDIARGRTNLESAAAASNGAHADLAFMLLADRPTELDAGKAVHEFATYLAQVPGDSRAWAGLAHAELLQDRRAEALSALKVSILTGPSLPGLLLWRCAVGIDLYPSLDAEGRRLLAGQFRVAAERSLDRLVGLVRRKNAVLVALALLSSSPDAVQRFSDRFTRIQ
jgi:hypothetical protein